ncbi:MAG: ABC transporter ATP-binding protein/permease [Bacilli bacterium]|nr:ABC transporter ATP-binding protein/permease [Bacilli bacterium]
MNEKARYWKLVKENKATLVTLSILSCLSSLVIVAFAFLSKLLLDNIGNDSFKWFAIAMGSCILLEVAIRLGLNIYFAKAKAGLENKIRKDTFNSFLKNSYSTIDSKSGGDWLNRITSDSRVIAEGVITYLPNFVSLTFRILLSFAVLCYVNWIFALVLLGLGIIAYVASRILRPHSKSLHKDQQEQEGEVLSFYKDSISNAFLLKLFSRSEKISEQCDAIQDKYAHAKIRFARFSIFINTGFTFFMRLSYLGAIIYASILIASNNGLTGYGDLLVMIQLISQIEGPFSSLSGLLPKYYQTLGSLERVMEYENETAKEREVLLSASTIVLDNVSFSYSKDNIISYLDVTISRGDFVLISGPSGKGKTTLLKLIMGAYSPTEGEIMIDGHKAEDVEGLFAYVPQGNYLLPTSIKENLTLFSNPTDEEILNALELVSLKDKVDSLKDGINTKLHDLGNGLSEGEGQRLSIARAILSNRDILILDECTSALDEETANRVLTNLKSLNKTIIMVSHKGESESYATKVIKL